MNTQVALDTSVGVPLLLVQHDDHSRIRAWTKGRQLAFTTHSLAETYSVLTRLPGEYRSSTEAAAEALGAGFEPLLRMKAATARRLPHLLSECGIRGGAVYDALVGLAARDHGFALVTLDRRARGTYEALGVEVETPL